MGMDFECGCKYSWGKWRLCDKHERDMIVSGSINTPKIKPRALKSE